MLPGEKQPKKHLAKEIHSRQAKLQFNFQVCWSGCPFGRGIVSNYWSILLLVNFIGYLLTSHIFHYKSQESNIIHLYTADTRTCTHSQIIKKRKEKWKVLFIIEKYKQKYLLNKWYYCVKKEVSEPQQFFLSLGECLLKRFVLFLSVFGWWHLVFC